MTENTKFLKELETAPTLKELGKEPIAKDLYNAYAKEVISKQGFDSDLNSFNEKVAKEMLKNNVREKRVAAALKYSPALKGQDNVIKAKMIKNTINQVKQANPELVPKKVQALKL